MTPSETSVSRYAQLEALQERVVALGDEVRVLRAAVARAMRCSCPVGFGQERDANCPKHGTAPVEGECVGGELDGALVGPCELCGAEIVTLERASRVLVRDGSFTATHIPLPTVKAICARGHWATRAV